MNAKAKRDKTPNIESSQIEAAGKPVGADEPTDDLLQRAPNSLSAEVAKEAVRADVASYTAITDPAVRGSVAIRMGQVASRQATYRDELANQSAGVAKEVGDAYRIFVGPDVDAVQGAIRRGKGSEDHGRTAGDTGRVETPDASEEAETIQAAPLPSSTKEAAASASDHLATLLNGRFVRNDKGEYRRQGEERLAFCDEGDQIRFVDKQMDAFQAGVELAKAKGWEAIEVTGTPAFRAEAWFHGRLAGVQVVGYEPSDKDLKRLGEAQRFNDPLIESKQAAQKFALDQGLSVRAVGDGTPRLAGPLIHETAHHVVQDLGRHTAVVHRKQDLDAGQLRDLIEAKTSVRVHYAHGKGSVEVPSRSEKSLQR